MVWNAKKFFLTTPLNHSTFGGMGGFKVQKVEISTFFSFFLTPSLIQKSRSEVYIGHIQFLQFCLDLQSYPLSQPSPL